MKAALLLATVLVFASSTSANYGFKCLTSDKMLDVGNLDEVDAIKQHFNSSAIDFGILSSKNYRTSNMVCDDHTNSHQDLTVNINIAGRWGNEGALGEVGHLEMRDAMLQAMWAFIQQTIELTKYDMYTDCVLDRKPLWPLPISDRRAYTEAICGPNSPNGDCPCPSHIKEWPRNCWGKKMSGHRLPSEFTIEVYDGSNKLMTEELTVTVTTTTDAHVSGQCGSWGGVLRAIVSFVPEVGAYWDKGLGIICKL